MLTETLRYGPCELRKSLVKAGQERSVFMLLALGGGRAIAHEWKLPAALPALSRTGLRAAEGSRQSSSCGHGPSQTPPAGPLALCVCDAVLTLQLGGHRAFILRSDRKPPRQTGKAHCSCKAPFSSLPGWNTPICTVLSFQLNKIRGNNTLLLLPTQLQTAAAPPMNTPENQHEQQ